MSCSFIFKRSWTVLFCPEDKEFPWSIKVFKCLISAWRFSIFCLLLSSRSLDNSRILNVFSSSVFRNVIVCESSWVNFSAVWTFAALPTISALRSLQRFNNFFSFSWETFKALCSFSYSKRNLSKLESLDNSLRT